MITYVGHVSFDTVHRKLRASYHPYININLGSTKHRNHDVTPNILRNVSYHKTKTLVLHSCSDLKIK